MGKLLFPGCAWGRASSTRYISCVIYMVLNMKRLIDPKELTMIDLTVNKHGRKLTPKQYALRLEQYNRKAERKVKPPVTDITERRSDWTGTPTDEDTPPW